jgi:hypothetical protein
MNMENYFVSPAITTTWFEHKFHPYANEYGLERLVNGSITPKMKEPKMKTLDLFDDKPDEQKLLEEYNVVDESGHLTQTGLDILGKLLFADKKSTIIAKLKADKDSKKKT